MTLLNEMVLCISTGDPTTKMLLIALMLCKNTGGDSSVLVMPRSAVVTTTFSFE